MRVKIKVVNKSGWDLPKYETAGAVGMDVRSTEAYCIRPGETKILPTGLYVEIPPGYEIQVRPRSGLSSKTKLRLANPPGTIDQDYRSDIGIIMDNTGENEIRVNIGDRIAQLVCCPVAIVEWDTVEELSNTTRGTGGFGSTGV